MRFKIPLIALGLVIVLIIAVLIWRSLSRPITDAKPQDTNMDTAAVAPPSINGIPLQEQSASDFISSFYVEYLKALAQNPDFSKTTTFRSAVTQVLSTDFATHFDERAQAAYQDPLVLGNIPVPASWNRGVHIAGVTQSGSKSTVLVVLGNGLESHPLVVILARESGNWKILSVEHGP